MDNELSIVMPCLNEADTLETCIKKAQTCLRTNNIRGEIIIADNGSTDGSQEIAVRNGAKVVNVKQKGYGSALKGGIDEAQGKYIIMGDLQPQVALSVPRAYLYHNRIDLFYYADYKTGNHRSMLLLISIRCCLWQH
jgi:glycosyltransferase involved in cell wall biosynthesis